MSERTPAKPLEKDILEPPTTQALNRIADALERLADTYLYVNLPQEEPSFEGQSLSDIRPESSLPSDFKGVR